MQEVTEIIENLQKRLAYAGGGTIIITDKDFIIKLGESRYDNCTSPNLLESCEKENEE